MMALAPADRTKLARVLGLLGSPHAGERDAAALAADRLVRGRGLSWSDVLDQHSAACAPQNRGAQTGQYEDPASVDLRACGQRLDLLTGWESAFVTDLAKTSARRFSAKQRSILAEIASKVRAAGPRRS